MTREDFVTEKRIELLAKNLFAKSHFSYMLNLDWETRTGFAKNHFIQEATLMLNQVYDIIALENEN